jgi:hypothetical protein
MSDIGQKVLATVNAARTLLGKGTLDRLTKAINGDIYDALVYSIKQHEALKQQFKTTKQEYSDFRQLVSDAVVEYRLPELFAINADGTTRERGFKILKSFIIPAPTQDPLVEVLGDLEWNNNSPECAAELRAALEARGLEIKEKE